MRYTIEYTFLQDHRLKCNPMFLCIVSTNSNVVYCTPSTKLINDTKIEIILTISVSICKKRNYDKCVRITVSTGKQDSLITLCLSKGFKNNLHVNKSTAQENCRLLSYVKFQLLWITVLHIHNAKIVSPKAFWRICTSEFNWLEQSEMI